MRVLYFGLPLGALLLLADGVEIAHAVLGRREGLGRRRLRRALGPARVSEVLRPEAWPSLVAKRAATGPFDLVVSWFFPRQIPAEWLASARLGGFGVHPSLLPRHRGPDPYFAAIDQGDAETGVTAHRLLADYDTGAILAQARLPIADDESAWSLAKRLDRPSLRVLREVTAAFATDSIRERPQDQQLVSYAPEPSPEQLELDAAMSPARALRRIRAAAPWPGISFWIDDQCVEIERARVATDSSALAPFEIATVEPQQVWLGVGGGALLLERVRLVTDEAPITLQGAALHAWAADLVARCAQGS